jgi:hypothetical protein
MIIDLGLHAVNSLIATVDFSAIDFSSLNLAHFHFDWQTLAASTPQPQQFNQDVTKDLAGGWNNFVRTGQIWALLIGVTLGYLFKSITSF